MKRLIVVAILSSIASLHAQPANGRQITVLDLTAPGVVRTSGVIGTEGGSTSTAKPQSIGLEVRFVSSSQSEFHLGDRFAYELEVRNSGSRLVDFPFSPDLAGFLPGPNTTVATIHLEARRKDQRTVAFGSMMLAGSDSVPGSLHRLESGDTLLIRVPAALALDGDDLSEFSTKSAIPVNVVVTFSSDVEVRWTPAVSKNSLPFAIRPQISMLHQRIGAAAPLRYANVRDAKDWNNPYLTIRADGIEVIARQFPSSRKVIDIGDLEQTLLELPVASWPYGRVVALHQTGLKAPDPIDDPSIAANLTKAIAILKKLGVAIEHWP